MRWKLNGKHIFMRINDICVCVCVDIILLTKQIEQARKQSGVTCYAKNWSHL